MNESPRLVEYATKLLRTEPERSEGVFSQVADSFEDDLLEFSDFPADYFAFVITLLSDEKFFSSPGAWNFLLVLGAEKEKLQSSHYERLAETILAHYPSYLNEDLCLAVCDFIARNYPEASGKRVLYSLKEIEKKKDPSLLGFADDGLRILEREISRGPGVDRRD